MTTRRNELAQKAVVEALRTRGKLGLSSWQPVCALDAADQLGLEVRLVDIPSMEGFYCRSGRPTIILSTLRPTGRQNFTCAHEIAHHVLGHGEQFDELIDQKTDERQRDPNEFMADCFAGAFLMPKTAVSRAFAVRDVKPQDCEPDTLYTIANWFGVGYATLVHHLRSGLGLMQPARANVLLRTQPLEIRRGLVGPHAATNLIVVDAHWTDVAIDLEMGDLLLLPTGASIEGTVLESQPTLLNVGGLQRAATPGIGRVTRDGTWSAFVRVRRKDYIGLARHRFEEEVGDGG